MGDDTEKVLRTMRYQAWERAKGELRSMLHTYWGEEGRYEAFKKKMSDFIEDVEYNGTHE